MGLPRVAIPEYSMTLPSSGKVVKYRPFLVKEEKLLLIAMEGEKEDEIMTAIKNVIKGCIYDELNVDTLPLFDIEYIFLWLRAKSKGETIELAYSCPTCKSKIPVSFNVEDIKIHRTKEHTNKIEFTDDLGVVLKYPDIVLQKKISSLEDLTEVEMVFQTILTCIDYIYDNFACIDFPVKDNESYNLCLSIEEYNIKLNEGDVEECFV